MSFSRKMICQVKGSVKYDGFDFNKRPGWFSGSLTIWRDTDHREFRLDMGYGANPDARGPSIKLVPNLMKKVTNHNDFKRIHIEVVDRNGTTINIREGNYGEMKAFFECLNKIKEGKMTSGHESKTVYRSHSDSALRTPNRSQEPQATKTTPKSEWDKENVNQGSAKKFTSVKTRYEDASDTHVGERSASKVDHFLQRAKEKASESLDSQPVKTPIHFYKKDSDVHMPRMYGSLGMQSGVKRPPQLLSVSSGPKSKKARTMSSAANNYFWRNSQSSSTSLSTHAAGLQGFSNLGNTCYMNAILQTLFNLETFSADIRNEDLHQKMPKNENLFKSLANLLYCKKSQCSAEKKRAALRQVKSAISSTAKRFSGYEQHDAHEFLNQVLDQLKEEILQATKAPASPNCDEQNRHLPPPELLLNPTSTNFEFEIIHTITCQQCHEQVTKTEQFNDLSVDMPRRYKNATHPLSLQDALDHFLRKEMIEYKCEECGHKKSEVTHKFAKLPRVLILHLKRYTFSSLAQNYKTGREIDIPKFIALGPHCEEETSPPLPPTLLMTPQKKPPDRKPSDLDAPDGIRKRLDLGADGLRKFTFRPHNKAAESNGDPKRKLEYSKPKADLQKYRVVEESLLEHQKMEQAQRQEELDLKRVLELSKTESLRQTPEKSRLVNTPGKMSSADLDKMSEEERIAYAINQSTAEADVFAMDHDNTPRKNVTNKNDFVLDADFMLESATESQDDGLKTSESDTDRLTGLKHPVGHRAGGVGEVGEHVERFSGAAQTEFLVNDGRPPSPPQTHDTDVDNSNSDEDVNQDGGDGDAKKALNGAESDERCVKNVSVGIPTKAGDASYFTDDMDDSVLLENDEFSDDKNCVTKRKNDYVLSSSTEDEDMVGSKIGNKRTELASHSDSTPEHLTFSHHGQTYSRSEQKRKPFSDTFSAFKRTFSAHKPLQKPSLFGRYDETDGISSSRKKEPEGFVGRQDSSEEEPDRWLSLNSSKKYSSSATKLPFNSRKPDRGADHDEVDLSYPDENPSNRFTPHHQPLEGTSAPKLTVPDSEWINDYKQKTEDNQLAAAIEKSKLDTGPTISGFDEEELRKATEMSLLEGVNFLPPDTEKDENFNDVEMERNEEEIAMIRDNAEKGELPYSYQLTSVVCHLGSSSSAGHYVSDIYDIRKRAWFSYDDSRVEKTSEREVRASRKKSGYIFFFMNKDAVEELKHFYTNRSENSGPSKRHSL